ncbi:hypothetical protein CAEBREN_07572 [Caenorhabditis brenneri]|uniref:BTB domain-containing protein n=1 Tax=Caenorhabditis brenneri TaxID=135651 RepID=G0P3B2_CAEBE|nr:hypothetical protein CAEBREN_07572 [Caenorhabditis brenneri]
MSISGNEFMLSHFFKDVSSMKPDERRFSPWVKKFGISWRLGAKRNNQNLSVFSFCSPPKQDNPWAIDTEFKLEVLSSKGKAKNDNFIHTFITNYGYGNPSFLSWDKLEKEYLVDDSFQLLAYVKIKKATGIQKKKLKDFSSLHRNHTDGVLIVEGEKFHISKGFLAKVSPYFRQLFYGNHLDADKEENELHGISSKEFQNFLEEIHGKDVIDEETVLGILKLARKFDLETSIIKCVEFLIEESEKTYKEKLAIAAEYQLVALRNHCIMRLDTKEAISAAMPTDVRDMDPTAAKLLLQKLVCIK